MRRGGRKFKVYCVRWKVIDNVAYWAFILINMTDSYQFDKNSKLFQKFLALKATKNNESFVDKPPVSDVPSGKSNENKNNFACAQ